ncbi:MAG: hypothetical protein ACRDZW_10135, partial [Acidimicrobiales bacterium]
MQAIGVGAELWRVRVDLFAEDGDGRRASAAAEALRASMSDDGDPAVMGGVGADQGLGVTSRPVVGLLFWVRADDVGTAATRAVEAACRAGDEHGVGPDLY